MHLSTNKTISIRNSNVIRALKVDVTAVDFHVEDNIVI